MKSHFQSWDWNLGLTCWMRPHPHPAWFHSTYWKKLLLSHANASTVQVSNHSSNQPLSVVKQTSPDMHISRGLEKEKKMHTHKTKVANTNTSKTKQNTKKNYVSKEIKLRCLSQIIELADKYIAKEHLTAKMDTRLQTFERIHLEMPSLRSVRSSEWVTKPRTPTSIVNNEGGQLVVEVIWSISCK